MSEVEVRDWPINISVTCTGCFHDIRLCDSSQLLIVLTRHLFYQLDVLYDQKRIYMKQDSSRPASVRIFGHKIRALLNATC